MICARAVNGVSDMRECCDMREGGQLHENKIEKLYRNNDCMQVAHINSRISAVAMNNDCPHEVS